MKYATIKTVDIANGTGVRVSLFVSGCTHHCPDCFNEIAWDFQYGEDFTQETIDFILQALAPQHISGLTLVRRRANGTCKSGRFITFIKTGS